MRYLFVMLLAGLLACSGKQESTSNEAAEVADSDDWTMMDDFHMVMAESFHPYKDSANLEPAIRLAPEMAELAARWSESELPAKVNNEEVKASLGQLKDGTAAFVTTVQSGDNDQIARELKTLHDIFHDLQDAWYSGDNHGHQHKH